MIEKEETTLEAPADAPATTAEQEYLTVDGEHIHAVAGGFVSTLPHGLKVLIGYKDASDKVEHYGILVNGTWYSAQQALELALYIKNNTVLYSCASLNEADPHGGMDPWVVAWHSESVPGMEGKL